MATSCSTSTRRSRRRARSGLAAASLLALALLLAQTRPEHDDAQPSSPDGAASAPDSRGFSRKLVEDVRTWEIAYTSHTGERRAAVVVLPEWYGPGNNPPLPVIVSPHGRGATGRSNAAFFDRLPAVGRFAVISPDGMGERLRNFSYGAPGHVDDLARMPELASRALPWLRVDRTRIYALGSSMGGQETLLLVARHPRLLAGAAALDSVTDLARRYRQIPQLPCSAGCLARWGTPYGSVLQSTMAREVGGSPAETPDAYAARSGLAQARAIAFSGVPLQLWWSTKDRIVWDQEHQSEALYEEVRRLNACAAVSAYVGDWAHSTEMRASALLPIALAGFGLLPADAKTLPSSVRHEPATRCAEGGETL
jgi:pimeloyl-ACP methyl ester carboxylesterase